LRYHEETEPHFREVSMRGTVGETLERLILLQVGAAAATRDRVQEVVDSLIEQGRIEREEGRTVVNDVMNRARERSAGARSLVDASVQQGLRRGGLPTREDHEDLVFRVEQLEHRVRMLEDRSATPTTGASPPAGGPEGVTGGPGVAPPPPRDEPGTPPGL
jgi:polyhydroxyalkanoate synthesis regulator phasin